MSLSSPELGQLKNTEVQKTEAPKFRLPESEDTFQSFLTARIDSLEAIEHEIEHRISNQASAMKNNPEANQREAQAAIFSLTELIKRARERTAKAVSAMHSIATSSERNSDNGFDQIAKQKDGMPGISEDDSSEHQAYPDVVWDQGSTDEGDQHQAAKEDTRNDEAWLNSRGTEVRLWHGILHDCENYLIGDEVIYTDPYNGEKKEATIVCFEKRQKRDRASGELIWEYFAGIKFADRKGLKEKQDSEPDMVWKVDLLEKAKKRPESVHEFREAESPVYPDVDWSEEALAKQADREKQIITKLKEYYLPPGKEDSAQLLPEVAKVETSGAWSGINEISERFNNTVLADLDETAKRQGVDKSVLLLRDINSVSRQDLLRSEFPNCQIGVANSEYVNSVAGMEINRVVFLFDTREEMYVFYEKMTGAKPERFGGVNVKFNHSFRHGVPSYVVPNERVREHGIILSLKSEPELTTHEMMHSIDRNSSLREKENGILTEIFAYLSAVEPCLKIANDRGLPTDTVWEGLYELAGNELYYQNFKPNMAFEQFRNLAKQTIEHTRSLYEQHGIVTTERMIGESKTIQDFLAK